VLFFPIEKQIPLKFWFVAPPFFHLSFVSVVLLGNKDGQALSFSSDELSGYPFVIFCSRQVVD